MKKENKVLACVDQSHFADYVADYAAWAARRMDGPWSSCMSSTAILRLVPEKTIADPSA
jgi:hypothetical protein